VSALDRLPLNPLVIGIVISFAKAIEWVDAMVSRTDSR